MRRPDKGDPLIVFVHVPKTAGSSVNKVLRYCSYLGRDHCEWTPGPKLRAEALWRTWVSGHMTRNVFEENLNRLEREMEYFSAVREPLAHLISHLNWMLEHCESYDYSEEIRSLDAEDPQSVMIFLDRHREECLNIQSRFIVGDDFASISVHELSARLQRYQFIATERRLGQLYRAFGFKRLPAGVHSIRENVLRRRFKTTAFRSAELRKFLVENNASDTLLYAAVSTMTFEAADRLPFRSTREACQLATPDRFAAQPYLDANPDVADVVGDDAFAAWEHFRTYGGKEGRLMRAQAFDG